MRWGSSNDEFGSPLAVLWGKSDAGGHVNLLLQHLLDTAAVGELMWAEYFAPSVRDTWDRASGGHGKDLFVLLCGLHDLGKATPAFQAKVPELAAAARAAGLDWRPLNRDGLRWHHTVAGALILKDELRRRGWPRAAVAWVWPFLAGHHGKVPGAARLRPPGLGDCHGRGPAWSQVQADVIDAVVSELGVDLGTLSTCEPPQRAAQLSLLGAVVMADWIASNSSDHRFPGIDDCRRVGMDAARERARAGWASLGMRGGWRPETLSAARDLVSHRFGVVTRPAQQLVVDAARELSGPGLLIVEAPMGEGKTEAALAAAEVLALRFGADGLFVGMPTQATSDPMFGRVLRWAGAVDGETPLALLHGKARFNPEWRDLRAGVRFTGVDEYGCDDPYGLAVADEDTRSGQAPAEWFLGRKRGLLTPVVVGTVDQLLHAATRTRHVMLRHAGLAGKVVVLDEVHAYDVYMAQFLHEALRWLADAGVPVIVLSATLPPTMRAELALSYLQGALSHRDVDTAQLPEPPGYPSVTSVSVDEERPRLLCTAGAPWRASIGVRVEVVPEPSDGSAEPVLRVLDDRLAGGGCALVIRNTVARAQATYQAARQSFGDDVVLLHARLTTGERADRTQRVLDSLGPPGTEHQRPRRLVVVATQLAEQSFDVDVDLLVTDLAPIDLLLQRAGRLHRHERRAASRPAAVRDPALVVTGLRAGDDGPPSFPRGSQAVYGDHLLLRAAAMVLDASSRSGWSVPADVPALVGRGYADQMDLPDSWTLAAVAADQEWRRQQERRRLRAEQFLLAGPDQLGLSTLAGLHERSVTDLDDEDQVAAVVRDGDPSVEVVLVRRADSGFATLDGRPLGPNGEAVSDVDLLERVVSDAVRLPPRPELTSAAEQELRPLPGWTQDEWLARTRALVLDDACSAVLGGWRLSYDDELGLITTREGRP